MPDQVQLVEQALEKAIKEQDSTSTLIAPYRIDRPYSEKDQSGDLILCVDEHLNLTAIARAIVEVSHER